MDNSRSPPGPKQIFTIRLESNLTSFDRWLEKENNDPEFYKNPVDRQSYILKPREESWTTHEIIRAGERIHRIWSGEPEDGDFDRLQNVSIITSRSVFNQLASNSGAAAEKLGNLITILKEKHAMSITTIQTSHIFATVMVDPEYGDQTDFLVPLLSSSVLSKVQDERRKTADDQSALMERVAALQTKVEGMGLVVDNRGTNSYDFCLTLKPTQTEPQVVTYNADFVTRPQRDELININFRAAELKSRGTYLEQLAVALFAAPEDYPVYLSP